MNTITFLKNKLMLFASIIFCIQCFAQNPEFKFYLAFEDSAGNKDTIWLGYDPSATLGIDTLFGEENIKGIPFNEPFEVRISNEWYFMPYDTLPNASDTFSYCSDGSLYHTKTQIYNFNPYSSGTSQIYINILCKNFPIIVRWGNSYNFLSDSLYGTLLTNWFPGGWFDYPGTMYDQWPTFLRETDTTIFNVLPYRYIDANNDTISLLFFAFLSKEQLNVGVDQFIPQTKLIEIFPNPFKDKIIITLSSDIDISEINFMVYNSIGQKILYNSNLKNNQIIIDLADEPNGLYYLIIMDNNKIIRTGKLIKL